MMPAYGSSGRDQKSPLKLTEDSETRGMKKNTHRNGQRSRRPTRDGSPDSEEEAAGSRNS